MDLPIPILSTVVFLPALGALLILLIRRDQEDAIRGAALTATVVTFLASAPLFWLYGAAGAAGDPFRVRETAAWVPSLGIRYAVGLDGISLMLVLLTTFLGPVCVLCSWTSIETRVKEFFASLLLLETGILGVFVAMDLVLFYVFWEVMLVPMFLLIGVWGGERRIYAAVKFILYTMAGSLLMLAAILYLYFRCGGQTFDIQALREIATREPGGLALREQFWLLMGFAIAFAIKVPIFPFHTWLPDAHTEAPTAGSVILAGVLLKLGAYGLIRIAIPFFPDAAAKYFMVPLTFLAVIGIIYGALMCLAQTDMKRLIAYSSVSHLGFVVLGIAAWNDKAVMGAVYQMLNHGISTGALFLLVGLIYERRHTRRIGDYGGLAKAAPWLAAVWGITVLSSVGLPGLNGFVGEFLILLGSFQREPLAAAFGALGVVLGAAYLLILNQRVFLGPPKSEADRRMPDLNAREWAYLVPIVAMMVIMGLFPAPFLDRIAGSTHAIVSSVDPWSR